MENLNGQKANQLAIYNPGLSVEQGTIRKHETHLLIREGLDLGTTHAPLYYSNSLLKQKTYSALDHFRSISIQSEICHIVLRKSNASEMCFVLTKYPQKLEETFVLNYEDFQSEATFE